MIQLFPTQKDGSLRVYYKILLCILIRRVSTRPRSLGIPHPITRMSVDDLGIETAALVQPCLTVQGLGRPDHE
jgi:hypothetical protein